MVAVNENSCDRRKHVRQRVIKTALLYPVLKEARLLVHDISQNGLSGECAINLSLVQLVHVSFDQERFVTAEVCWMNGMRCGLQTEDPIALLPDDRHKGTDDGDVDRRATKRLPVDLAATLVTSAPVFAGRVRNMSDEGMMIEAAGLAEGTRLLVKARGCDMRMGRVQWASGGMVGVFFERSSLDE